MQPADGVLEYPPCGRIHCDHAQTSVDDRHSLEQRVGPFPVPSVRAGLREMITRRLCDYASQSANLEPMKKPDVDTVSLEVEVDNIKVRLVLLSPNVRLVAQTQDRFSHRGAKKTAAIKSSKISVQSVPIKRGATAQAITNTRKPITSAVDR